MNYSEKIKNITICSCNNKEIIEIIKYNYQKVLDFFEYSPKLNIYINILNYEDFKNEFKNYMKADLNNYVTGFIEDDTNTIIYLNYNDWDKTIHHQASKEEYEKVIMHEFIHIIHSNYCQKKYPNDNLWEGIAYYLANQKDNKYYDYMDNLIKNISHKILLNKLKNY